VILTGRVPHDTVPEHIAAMDVTVAPYPPMERFHFSPIKLFEYMAMGRAVVTVPLEEIPRVVNGGATGAFYEPGNAESLARAFGQLLKDPTQRERLGAVARSWVLQERTWTVNAHRIAELFRSAAAQLGGLAPPRASRKAG
jgi:glycosyltransferase involved in cell wall biosynthesis